MANEWRVIALDEVDSDVIYRVGVRFCSYISVLSRVRVEELAASRIEIFTLYTMY